MPSAHPMFHIPVEDMSEAQAKDFLRYIVVEMALCELEPERHRVDNLEVMNAKKILIKARFPV